MDSTSRKPSRTLTRALSERRHEATRSFASSLVRVILCVGEVLSDPLRRCTGKGIHSPNHAAKLKPAIEELIQK